MSHELKNPLNSIIGYSEILIEGLDETESRKCKDLDSIRDAGHRLLGLIDDLLDLSKLEAGKMTLHADRTRLRSLFDRMTAEWRPTIVESGNEFCLQPPADVDIVCDVVKLQRVIANLLSNAAKFTKNGRITFAASIEGCDLVMSVDDTGVGIPPNRIDLLFETFRKSEEETASNYGDDVRLGLPLAQRYCRLMGGELSVQSELGFGSRFTVRVPVRQVGNELQRYGETALLTEAA